jgi:hypothetical protein
MYFVLGKPVEARPVSVSVSPTQAGGSLVFAGRF